MKSPIICALDTNNIRHAVELVDTLKDDVGAFKVGLELYSWFGFPILDQLSNVSIFLDLKFHDIPNTVSSVVKRFEQMPNISMMTVHASGGENMIKAAVDSTDHIDVIAVTLLTSIKDKKSNKKVKEYTEMALNAGAAGVVCSANEVKMLRRKFGDDFKIIVPGIRPLWYNTNDDQERIGTPNEVINNGATFLVVGRPITTADDPLEAAKKINNEL